MKYIVILCDGMADEPLEKLGGKTPLEAARTPNMDRLAKCAEIGMVRTVPEGMAPGSDTANLSVIGYDPEKYYAGRSPLEALSIGAKMGEHDVSFRCNLVTLSEEEEQYEERTILDHSSGEISTEEAGVLLEAVKKELETEEFQFYLGTSYRHCLIWHGGKVLPFAAPHDHLGENIGSGDQAGPCAFSRPVWKRGRHDFRGGSFKGDRGRSRHAGKRGAGRQRRFKHQL